MSGTSATHLQGKIMSLRIRHLSALLLGVIAIAAVCPSRARCDGTTFPVVGAANNSDVVPIETSFDATLASRYLFQGIDYSDGRSVVQPNLVVTQGTFSAVVWANYQPNLGDVNEVDISLKSTSTAGKM